MDIATQSFLNGPSQSAVHRSASANGLPFASQKVELGDNELVRNTISAVFLKDQMVYPLLTTGTYAQDVFKLSFKDFEGCKLHQCYVEILRALERERKADEEKRR